MLSILDLIFLGATMVANIVLYADCDVEYPMLGQVAQVSFHREWWREESECHFTGLMVPYARTWDETINNSYVETVLPPEHEKIAGYAFIINKKECPGKEAEAMFRVAARIGGAGGVRKIQAKYSRIDAVELNSLREDQRPKWLQQVMEAVVKVSEASPVAKEFLNYTRQAEAAAKARRAAEATNS